MNKLSLPTTIIIAALILGFFYFVSEKNKQGSIERQQQAELQQKREIEERNFIAGQKEACLAIYKQESSKWNNVNGWTYSEFDKECYIEYKQSPKKTRSECDADYKNSDGKLIPALASDYLLCLDGLFRKSF